MAIFSLLVDCVGAGSYLTQYEAESPYDAIREFLRTPSLNRFLEMHPDWPRDFKLRDMYMLIPLDGLKNIYSCGLGQQGKYIQIQIVQTAQRSSAAGRYCGPRRKLVKLR
jgi:hypothetical protein